MDPEIQRALQAGYKPAQIAAELQRRGLPVPPELLAMAGPTAAPARAVADATRRTAPTETPEGTVPAALAALGIGAGVVGGTAAAVRAVPRVANHIATSAYEKQMRRAVGEIPGGMEQVLRQLQGFRETGRGGDVTLSDIDPRLSAEADFAATNNQQARAKLSALNTERRRAMPQRLLNDVERIAPGGYADAAGVAGQLQNEQRAFAAGPEGFEGLRQANPALKPEGARQMAQFLSNPRVARAWSDAAAVGAVGPLPKADAMSFEVLQGLKERLDGLTDAAYRKGDGDLGRRLAASRDELVNIMTDAVPNYREVSARYAQFSQQRQAVELGGELWRDNQMQLPELERRVAGLGDAERALLQKGMLGAYITDIENARKNAGFFEQMMTRLPVQQRKLDIVFGGKEGFERALQTYEQELAMGRLGEVIGGSQTARRGAQQATSTAEVVGEAAHVATHPLTGVPSVARRGISKWMPGAVAERMEPLVTARGADQLEELLRALMRYR